MKYAGYICIGILIGACWCFFLMVTVRDAEQDRQRCRNCGNCSTIRTASGEESIDLLNCDIGRGVNFRAPINGIYHSAVQPGGYCDRWTPNIEERPADG